MVFDGVKFNDEWMLTKTEAEFIEHEKHTLPEKKLREVYAIVQKLHNGNSSKPDGEVAKSRRKQSGS